MDNRYVAVYDSELSSIMSSDRWIIKDSETDEVVDDAQGYGYKSGQAAHKALWYKYNGGRQSLREREAWFESNGELCDDFRNWIKTDFDSSKPKREQLKDGLLACAAKRGVVLSEKMLKYLVYCYGKIAA